MPMEAWVLFQPCPNLGMLGRTVCRDAFFKKFPVFVRQRDFRNLPSNA
jgi:hypothetical protein